MKKKLIGFGLVVAGLVGSMAWALSALEALRAGAGV